MGRVRRDGRRWHGGAEVLASVRGGTRRGVWVWEGRADCEEVAGEEDEEAAGWGVAVVMVLSSSSDISYPPQRSEEKAGEESVKITG